ncbi:MAG: hypothetical protein AB1679_02440 [Actinomycetota bacterium]
MRRRLLPLVCAVALAAPPAAAGAAGDAVNGPPLAIFAAGAEAWAFSVEAGIPGPLGPLASHTSTSIDNSPHALGAAGLADPGYLVRAAAGLMLGVPTPTYCESAHPEGPPESDCGAPSAGAAGPARVHTRSGAGPDAVASAGLASVSVPGGTGPALTVDSQSTTSTAEATATGVRARSVVTLHGVRLAGGAVGIGTLEITRVAEADGTPSGLVTSTELTMSGVTVAGQAIDPGTDAVAAVAKAARATFGDRLRISAQQSVEERTPDGKLTAQTTGLEVLWQPAPERWVRLVLGFARTLVYAVPPSDPASPVAGALPDLESSPETPGPGSGRPSPAGPVPEWSAGTSTPAGTSTASGSSRSAETAPGQHAPGGSSGEPSADGTAGPAGGGQGVAPAAGAPSRPEVRWVSPFLVLAQMTDGGQIGWFLLALPPLLLVWWGWRRAVPSLARGR